MTSTTTMSEDEVAVRALVERRANALRTKSATETMATQTADYVQYPLTGVLEYSVDTAMTEKDFDAVFEGFEGPVSYETRDLHVSMADRVAVTRSLARITATLLTGDVVDMWFRKTLVLEKVDGTWLISHEHESVPIASDGTDPRGHSVVDSRGPIMTAPADTSRADALAHGFEGFELRSVARDGVSIGYRLAGEGPAVLLVHGWPQSGYTWHRMAADLVRDHTVVVPDYRGAAGSDKPEDGYDKATMAADLHAVLVDAGVSVAHVVGHDIGMMVAYAFARGFPEATATLTLIDGFIPGTPMFASIMSSLGPWHFGFHSQVELAVATISGRERTYFDHWYDTVMVDPKRMPDADRDFYARQFQAPGALAAGFRTYRAATSVDVVENERVLAAAGRLALPVLGIGGNASLGPYLVPLLADVADDATTVSIEGAGHFLAEEKPGEVVSALRDFFAAHAG